MNMVIGYINESEDAGSGIRVSQMNIKYQYRTMTPQIFHFTITHNANFSSYRILKWFSFSFMRINI